LVRLTFSTTSAEEEEAVWRALAAMPDLRHEVQEVPVDGDVEMARVVVAGALTSRFGGIESTGRRFRMDQAVITHLREGKIAEAWEIADIASLRAQVSDGYSNAAVDRADPSHRTTRS
jgi:predicted ester cyclase